MKLLKSLSLKCSCQRYPSFWDTCSIYFKKFV